MCASLQNIWRSPVRKKSSEFSDIFRQENPKFSSYFRVNKLGYSFHYPAIFLFKSAVNRWENGWYSLLIGVFQQQKIALKEVFLQRQCVSFHFPRTGKCIENAWKPRVVQCSRVGQRKEIWCFLAFVSCLRRENVLLSAIHHPNAVIPTHFYEVAIRLSCEKWYLFLYSSVFYTVNHLDIYEYVYYTYIMFWWRKKKLPYCFTHRLYACLFLSEESAHLIIFVRASLRNIWCSPVRKTSSEYLKTRHSSYIFLTFSDKRIQSFPVAFNSANWSIRSIIQQFSSSVNSMKTIVFLVLRRRCQMGTGLYSLLTGVFQ